MIRTSSGISICGPLRDQHMSGLRMEHSMMQLSVTINTTADTRTDGQIHDTLFPLCLSEGHFAEDGTIHIRIKSHGAMKCLLHLPHNIAVPPGQLWRGCDITVFFGISVQLNGSKTGNSQCIDPLVPKISDHLRNRLLRRSCRNRYLFINCTILIPNSADHFCTAGFQCTQT